MDVIRLPSPIEFVLLYKHLTNSLPISSQTWLAGLLIVIQTLADGTHQLVGSWAQFLHQELCMCSSNPMWTGQWPLLQSKSSFHKSQKQHQNCKKFFCTKMLDPFWKFLAWRHQKILQTQPIVKRLLNLTPCNSP